MAKHKFLYLLASVFTFSCMPPSGIVVIQPEYETDSLKNVSLLVSVPRSEVVADNPKEINALLGSGDPDSVLYAFCESHLPQCLLANSFSQTVMMAEFKHDTSFEVSEFMIDNTLSFSLDLPKDGYCLYMNAIDNTFLFLPAFSKDRSFPLVHSELFSSVVIRSRSWGFVFITKL